MAPACGPRSGPGQCTSGASPGGGCVLCDRNCRLAAWLLGQVPSLLCQIRTYVSRTEAFTQKLDIVMVK